MRLGDGPDFTDTKRDRKQNASLSFFVLEPTDTERVIQVMSTMVPIEGQFYERRCLRL